jgi:hypothetical protein
MISTLYYQNCNVINYLQSLLPIKCHTYSKYTFLSIFLPVSQSIVKVCYPLLQMNGTVDNRIMRITTFSYYYNYKKIKEFSKNLFNSDTQSIRTKLQHSIIFINYHTKL